MAKIKHNSWSSDPLFSEAYSQMSEADLALINDIAADVNKEVDRRVAAMPFVYRYIPVVMLGLFAALTTLTIYKISTAPDLPIVQNNNSGPDQKNILGDLSNDEEKDLHEIKESFTEEKQESITDKTDHQLLSNSNTKLLEENKNDFTPENLNEQKSDIKPETKTEVKKTENTDNTRNFIEEGNKMVMLRVGGASVISKTNSYDNETNTSENKKVNDPNIGSKVITKPKSNSYSIDDMPYYQGGDAAFISYLNRNLNYKISLMRKEVVSSVNVQFTVTAKGNVENVQIIGDVPPAMEKEILKVVKEAPDWKAGKKTGKKGSLDIMINLIFY